MTQQPIISGFPTPSWTFESYMQNRDLFGQGWLGSAQITYGTSLLRASLSFLDRRFLGSLGACDWKDDRDTLQRRRRRRLGWVTWCGSQQL